WPEAVDHRLSRGRRIGDGDRTMQRQHRVDLGSFQKDFQRSVVALARRVSNDVYRVASAPGDGQQCIQTLDRLLRQLGKLTALVIEAISRQYSAPTAIGQDGQASAAVARQGRGCRECLRRVEELFQRED